LTFDLLTLKVVSESRVTWATSVLILVFLGISLLELGPMYATDRRQTRASLNASALWGGGITRSSQPVQVHTSATAAAILVSKLDHHQNLISFC